MPHLVILYTGQLDAEVSMSTLCKKLADAMRTVKDENYRQVFPTGGIRVMAYPAPHYAVADGKAAGGTGDYAFVYLNLRMGRGRSEATQQLAGLTLAEVVKDFFATVLENRPVGVTFQIDVGAEVFDSRQGNLHPLFR